MTNVSYTILKRRQTVHIKAYALLCLVIVVCMGFFSYQKWQEYSLSKEAISKNKELIVALRNKVSDEKSVYESEKDGFNNLNKEIEEKLKYILPASDNYTDLTRQIDSYEEELSRKNNPFEIANIDYQSIVETENYSILPFRMNIKSSGDNFTKFLHLIENSGSLKDQVRVMDIQSIRLNFSDSENEGQTSESIDFTVQINAYFQK